MTSRKDHFVEFKDHTLLKHAILRAYLQSWAFKLLQWGGGGKKVFFVDGFAGAGRDQAGNHGSPMIACRVARQVRGAFKQKADLKDARVVVIAIEESARYFATLVDTLAPFVKQDAGTVFTLRGQLVEHMIDIEQRVGAAPALYFLDPFGMKGLDARLYPRMLAGPSNEVFALFSDMGGVRLRGVVHGDNADVDAQLAALRAQLTFFPEVDARKEAALVESAERRQAARDRTLPAAAEAISLAIGEEAWIEDLKESSDERVREELLLRFAKVLFAAGAAFVHFLPMRGENGKHKHFLVHASKSRKGWTAMKEAVSAGLKREELSEEMRERIKEDLRVPTSQVLVDLAGRFAGKEVPWASTVKRFLLDETNLFDFQREEIKKTLTEQGIWSRRKHRELCTFPPASANA